jgi:hypothetical protein
MAIRRLHHARGTGSQGRCTPVHWTRSALQAKTCLAWGSGNVAQSRGRVGENLTQVRRSVYEQRILRWTLGIGRSSCFG